MLESLKSLIAHRRDIAEVDALSPSELDDIGLSRGELRAVVAMPAHVVARQEQMAERFGLTPDAFNEHRHDHGVVLQRCEECGASSECARYLAVPGLPPDQATFCPNAETYRDLSAQT